MQVAKSGLHLTGKRNDLRLEATEMLIYHLVFADPAWNGAYPSIELGRNKSQQIANKLEIIMDDDYDMEETIKNVGRWIRTIRDIYGEKTIRHAQHEIIPGFIGWPPNQTIGSHILHPILFGNPPNHGDIRWQGDSRSRFHDPRTLCLFCQ